MSRLAMVSAVLGMYAVTSPSHMPLPIPAVQDNSRRVIPSPNQSKRIKGSLRNLICTCGSGKKRKLCPCGGRA